MSAARRSSSAKPPDHRGPGAVAGLRQRQDERRQPGVLLGALDPYAFGARARREGYPVTAQPFMVSGTGSTSKMDAWLEGWHSAEPPDVAA
jgi:hypothetical protein